METNWEVGDVAEWKGTYYTFVTGPNEHGQTVWQTADESYVIFGVDTVLTKVVSPPKDLTLYVVLYRGKRDSATYNNLTDARDDYGSHLKSSNYTIGKYEFVEYV